MIAHDLFTVGVPIAEKVLRTVAVYAALGLILRVAGKRDLAQLTSFDLVVMLLLSNVVQNAIIGEDNSLIGGLLGAVVLVAVNAVVVRAAAHPALSRLMQGSPTVLIRDGHYDEHVLRREGLNKAEVAAALRRQNADDPGQVAEATLNPGGVLVVDLRPDAQSATRGDVARLEAKLDHLLARG
ncbi:MAG: DUF421 domain-containing protein [Mycobacteriales bacterium]